MFAAGSCVWIYGGEDPRGVYNVRIELASQARVEGSSRAGRGRVRPRGRPATGCASSSGLVMSSR